MTLRSRSPMERRHRAATPLAFDRRGDLKIDPKGVHVLYVDHDGRRLLGEATGQYRDEDECLRLNVKHFNGEPWPVDPPAGCVFALERTYDEEDA